MVALQVYADMGIQPHDMLAIMGIYQGIGFIAYNTRLPKHVTDHIGSYLCRVGGHKFIVVSHIPDQYTTNFLYVVGKRVKYARCAEIHFPLEKTKKKQKQETKVD